MTHSTSEEKKEKGFNKSTLKIFLFFYLFFSLFRFFIYGDSILSKDPTVILTAISIVVFLIVNSWLKSLLTINMNKKKYRYLISPIKSAIVTYIIISLTRYAILQDSFVANNIEVITFSIMVGIMESVGAKIDDVSPRDPKKEPDRPLKYYIDKFIINAKPFHKVMFLVYGSCMSLLIFIFILMMFE